MRLLDPGLHVYFDPFCAVLFKKCCVLFNMLVFMISDRPFDISGRMFNFHTDCNSKTFPSVRGCNHEMPKACSDSCQQIYYERPDGNQPC